MEKGLNVDIPGSVAQFEALINKVYPKKFFYRLLLRGKGLEFDSYRKFSPDEDSELIDWKASIRSNTLLAKQYVEERDIKTLFLVDVSNDMIFGSGEKLKCEYAAEVASSLSRVMINGGDQVGFILFSNGFVKVNQPKAGTNVFDIFSNELSNANNYGGFCDFKGSLNNLLEFLNPSISFVVIISDFIKVDESYKDLFDKLGAIVETIAIIVKDPLDLFLPELNKEIILKNPDNSETLLINPAIARRNYELNAAYQDNLTRKILEESNIDHLEMLTTQEFAPILASFLKNRAERR